MRSCSRPRAKYIYIGRDGRDVVWSLYNHHANANEDWYQALNDTPGRVGSAHRRTRPPTYATISANGSKATAIRSGPFWENVRSWWAIRDLPNVMLLHFAELKRDLAGEIRRIAAFLDIPIDEARFPAIVEHCSFDYMKHRAPKTVPVGGAFWDGGRGHLHPQGHQWPLARRAHAAGLRRIRGARPGRAWRRVRELAQIRASLTASRSAVPPRRHVSRLSRQQGNCAWVAYPGSRRSERPLSEET